MLRRAALATLVILALAAPALAQESRATVGFSFGWTLSDGVLGNAVKAPDGNTYNRLDPKGSANFDFNVGFFASSQVEVGFLYGHQMSTLQAGGTSTLDLGSMGTSTYHGYFAYNFGESDARLRPYILGGLGMTSFSDVTTTVGGGSHTLSGSSRFSSTWGGGVKYYPNPKAGVQFGIRWTPAYIKTGATGWWCDPWWGCYLLGNAQYANQLQFNGGVTLKF